MLPPQWEVALEMAHGRDATPKELERVATATSPDAARWAFSQWALRARATAKFKNCEVMLFDRDGLEMASHERVAAYHASLFPDSALVADLTCGIGSDLIALAKRGPAIGFDHDAERAELAKFNLAACGLPAEVVTGDCAEAVGDYDYVFADPARRAGGSRIRRLSEFQPDPHRLAHDRHRLRVIKLSPMLADDELATLGGEVRFISFGRECREALVVAGEEAVEGVSAVHVETGSILHPMAIPLPKGDLGAYMFDPDPAAVRSRSAPGLAKEAGLHSVDGTPFLTGPSPVVSPWLRCYEVLEVTKWDARLLESALANLEARTPDIKTHGHDIEPARWVRKLKRKGSNEVAIFAIGTAGNLAAVLCQPKETEASVRSSNYGSFDQGA